MLRSGDLLFLIYVDCLHLQIILFDYFAVRAVWGRHILLQSLWLSCKELLWGGDVIRRIVPSCLIGLFLNRFFEWHSRTWFFYLRCFKHTLSLTLIYLRLIDLNHRLRAIQGVERFVWWVLQKAYALFPLKKVTRASPLRHIWLFRNASRWRACLCDLVSDSWIVKAWTWEVVLLLSWPSHPDSKLFRSVSEISHIALPKRTIFMCLFVVKPGWALWDDCWLRAILYQSVVRIVLSRSNRLSNLIRPFNTSSKRSRSVSKFRKIPRDFWSLVRFLGIESGWVLWNYCWWRFCFRDTILRVICSWS